MVVEDALVHTMPCPSASFPTVYIYHRGSSTTIQLDISSATVIYYLLDHSVKVPPRSHASTTQHIHHHERGSNNRRDRQTGRFSHSKPRLPKLSLGDLSRYARLLFRFGSTAETAVFQYQTGRRQLGQPGRDFSQCARPDIVSDLGCL